MLTILRIKNLALVTDLTLELRPGYNTISGETGAGKSIILGALNLVLGERADRTLIRSGTESCSVEAIFDVSPLHSSLHSLLDENGLEPCENSSLVLKRSFNLSGLNRQFVNGSPTTLKTLALVGRRLIDIHGPHDHQSLLYPSRQLAVLDAYGKLTEQRETFSALVRRKAELEREKAQLIVNEQTYARHLDLLRFQVREIDSAQLDPEEEPRLNADFRRAANTARILQITQSASGILTDDEQSILARSGTLGRLLVELHSLDPDSKSLLDLHAQSVTLQNELQTGLTQYADTVETDTSRYQQLEERLNLIQSLERKYGRSLRDVLAFRKEAAGKLEQLEQRDTVLGRINSEIEKTVRCLQATGNELSKRRRAVIPKLVRRVVRELSELGFSKCLFEISVTTRQSLTDADTQYALSGLDSIGFQFAPNQGEPSRSLRAIASSGELARVMLALKTVLAAQDEIPVLLFDEVDANVGGETAKAVGQKMRQIAEKRQVLCITHLAPVAAVADSHFVVAKQVKAGRTESSISAVTGQDRIVELARMLGGKSTEALKHAKALLNQ